MAIKAREALAISPCTGVLSKIVHWDHRINRTCFEDLPIYLANQWVFASPHTKVIKLTFNRTDCYHRTPPAYKRNEKWIDGDHEIQLRELHQRLTPVLHEQQIDFTARPFLDLEVEKIEKEI